MSNDSSLMKNTSLMNNPTQINKNSSARNSTVNTNNVHLINSKNKNKKE